MSDILADHPTVCIAHGAFVPCRHDGRHRYTDNPHWVKSVRDYHGSDDPDLTWEPVWSAEPTSCPCECHKLKHEARRPHPSTMIGRP